MRHETRFCTSFDGIGLAYAIDGEGPPLVKASNWMTHLDYERESPVWRHCVRELSRGHTLVRYDERGCGLSDRRFEGTPTVDTYVSEVRGFLGVDERALTAPGDVAELSRREHEVLSLVAAGMSNEQIGERLFLSTRTVERHLWSRRSWTRRAPTASTCW